MLEEGFSTAVVWYAEKNVDFIDAFNAAWMMKNDVENAFP